MNTQDLLNRFSYHATENPQAGQHDEIRKACLNLAGFLDATVPDSREKSLAMTKLEEVMFWSNAALARPPAAR